MQNYPPWPHRLVFNFAYGRWWTFLAIFATTYFIFYLAGTASSSREEATQLFFCFIFAYLIPASHYVSAQTVIAFDNLKPTLNLTDAQQLAIRNSLTGLSMKSQGRRLVAGFLAGCGHDYILLTAEFEFLEAIGLLDPINMTIMLMTILLWCLFTAVISLLLDNVWLFARLAKNDVRIDLLNSPAVRGFSRVAVYSTLVLMGALAGFPLLVLQGDANYIAVLPGLFAVIVPMVLIFLVPLLPIRKRLQQCKLQELDLIQNRINELTLGQIKLVENSATLSQLQPLLDYRREILQVPEWPFDSPVIFRLLFYLFIPPMTWVGAAIIERLVDTVNF